MCIHYSETVYMGHMLFIYKSSKMSSLIYSNKPLSLFVCVCVQVKDVMKDVMSSLQQTNSEKILLSWVRNCTRNYNNVNVLNFTTSWADGLAFNAILHHFR